MFFAIIIAIVVLAWIAIGLGLSFLELIGILLGLFVVVCIGAYLFSGESDKREKLETEEEKAAFDKKIKKKQLIGKLILIAGGIALVIIVFGGIFGSCDYDSGSSSSSGSSYDSDYDSGYNSGDSGGRFGHGEQYDRDVDYVAGIFYD